MKVLITGGAGFIGSNLADRLLARGDEVFVLDNFTTGRRENLTPQEKLTVLEGDCARRSTLRQVFDEFQPEIVVHAAASYKDPENWHDDVFTNTLGTAMVAQESKKRGVKRFIYFQTALCYGLRPEQYPITIDHPISPLGSSYAISKTAGEHYIEHSGLDYISLRLANVYGPRNLSGPLPTFFMRLNQGKECIVMDTKRDFVFVDDLLDVVEKAIDGVGEKGAYHVSSGVDISIAELYSATRDAMGLPHEQPNVRERGPDDAPTLLLDPSITNQEFNWKTKTSLLQGVRKAVAWYREHGVTQTFTHLKLED